MKRAASEVYGELKERAQEIGLNIRVEKTKVMVQNRTRRMSEILTKIMTLKLLGALIIWGL
jgi:hydrogenase maturation factor